MKIKINPDVVLDEKTIINDIEKFTKTCAMTIIEEAQNQLDKFAFGEMAEYYLEYEPIFYDRTGQMGDLSYQKYMTIKGTIYEGGIFINSAFTNHEKGEEYTEEYIYNDVWIKGIHGRKRVGRGGKAHWREIKGLPERMNRIKKKAYSENFKNKLLAKGIAKAKSQSYSILKFS